MNKKTLGVIIPYYKNSDQCEHYFRKLIDKISKQLNNDMLVYVFEDGQNSEWLDEYSSPNIAMYSTLKNKGVSYARNAGIDYLINKVNYILFLDSDDDIDEDYLIKMQEICSKTTCEAVESKFYVNSCESQYNPNKIRNGVTGMAIKSSIIGDIRFDETLQVCEDTKFILQVLDLEKHKKVLCDTKYTYQFGVNPNSLIMKFNRKEIIDKR